MPSSAQENIAPPNQRDRILSQMFAQVFRAYMESSDDVQSVIREMCQVINDESTDKDDCEAAYDTLIEALFPVSHDGELGIDIVDLREASCNESEEFRREIESFDKEENRFAERLEELMKTRGINQTDLADKIGVQQPAISMILNRKCRPQRRTVEKIASALGVSPEDLWPNEA